MRIAVLWSELSGYFNACLKELAAEEGVELFVAHVPPSIDAPYDGAMFDWMENRYQWKDDVDPVDFLPRLERFRPDVMLCVNWHNRGYRKALLHFRGRAVRIFASDRPWMGSARQWLGVVGSRFYLHPLSDAMFVAGERQAMFARKMGFKQGHILRGLLSCDHAKFSEIHRKRSMAVSEPCSFVYVGRFTHEKGLDVLVRAYASYRSMASRPWPLKCYGAGPLGVLLEGVEGIERKGFCQPDHLPDELLQASCLVLPSIFEPWALVVHEAAAAGMAVIASDGVGASAHLVQDGYSGYIVETGDADELAQAMLRYAALSPGARREMGENSHRMSLQFTPRRWAHTLLAKSEELMTRLPGKK